MNYFDAIRHRADELNALGQKYLADLPFMNNQEVIQRLVKAAYRIYDDSDPDTEKPWWVLQIAEGDPVPYGDVPRNGSIYFSLGYAIVARDALLRNLLELAEGRTTEELPFPCLAELEIVNRYCPFVGRWSDVQLLP